MDRRKELELELLTAYEIQDRRLRDFDELLSQKVNIEDLLAGSKIIQSIDRKRVEEAIWDIEEYDKTGGFMKNDKN